MARKEMDPMTVAVPKKEEKNEGPKVPIFIPALEDSGSEGLKVDQYEHVSIANEEGEKITYVQRGIRTEVGVPEFMVLKEKYPNL